MSKSNISESLEDVVARLVQAEIARIQVSVAAGMARGMSGADSGFCDAKSGSNGGRRRAAHTRARPAARRQQGERGVGRRRGAEELAAIGERLLTVVRENPGETMATLASKLDIPARQLSRPATHLKNQGLVRTTGERSRTRYYPGVSRQPSAAA
jgi:hypothetical protein